MIEVLELSGIIKQNQCIDEKNQFFDESADKNIGMDNQPKTKNDVLLEMFGGRMVGGALSQLASYSELFMKMTESVFLLDRHSLRVLECNPAACRLLKTTEEEILGRELPGLIHLQEATAKEALEFSLHKFQKKEEVNDYHFQQELELKNAQGEILYFEVSATRLKILDYIEVIQFIARDVTEVKKAQRELQELNEALRNLSTTDEMTGLRNYRYFKEVIATVHHQAQNFHHEYGVIFIDVDHFKKFNDRNGHPAGDEVLRKVSAILKECSRPQDFPARYGGEEFVVLCRNSSLEETEIRAEIIRKKIESTVFPFGEFQPLGKVSASIGVAVYPTDSSSPEEVLNHADQALYVSKEAGRNRVTNFLTLKNQRKAA
jgi:diguanylate cyclase (GGDEF)-like protein/PAS domain S-box-containing protein